MFVLVLVLLKPFLIFRFVNNVPIIYLFANSVINIAAKNAKQIIF
jgi:hypothetical protein